ncbi:protein of unknown function [Marinobacterium lutimaris]|uniref:DUF4123 domain-containing protein n=2 Tax=Marinobacterium lutimaris TaxID=568106 RepID=A0A1H5UF73_9GAMM|nr:protein of unknown function [Marinobacterium lutimaris]
MSLSNEELKTRVFEYIRVLEDKDRDSVSVCAVVETGLLAQREREALWGGFKGHPWLQQSQFEALRPLGPWLFQSDIDTLLSKLYPMAESGLHGLLLTHQPVADEAKKLGQLCVVEDENGEAQLLRYYAPHVMPVLHRRSDMRWHSRLFGSLGLWWLPGLDGWLEYAGRWNSKEPPVDSDSTITMTPELIQAIGSDPLTHQILAELERSSPSLFEVACPGLRLAIVDSAVDSARMAGLDDIKDLSVFAAYCVAYGMEVVRDPGFSNAVDLSVTGPRSLAENLEMIGPLSIREKRHD